VIDSHGPGASDEPVPASPQGRALPPLPAGRPGRARELSRRRTSRTPLPDTGRRHHIGAAPSELVVRREDGTMAVTWTAAIQLADQTDAQLAALARRIESDMSRAAAALEFEQAAHLREEAAAARRELQRRLGD
jgi:hypothetical protein